MAADAESNMLSVVLKQATRDTRTAYLALRESLTEEEVGESNRDVVAATLTSALLLRVSQIAASLD